MPNRSIVLIVATAILSTTLGLFAAAYFGGGFTEKSAPPEVTVLKVGDTRADVGLTGLDGKPRHLAEFDGQLVLLNFWASWCGPCREEMPLLDALQDKPGAKGLRVVGVAIDDATAVRDFLKSNPVRYPILLGDEENDPSLLFGDTRSVLPYSVLIGRDGKILAQRAGNFTENSLIDWLRPYR